MYINKRVLIKLSGEALAAGKGFGMDDEAINEIAKTLKEVHELGVEIGIVVGGGNFWRGRNERFKSTICSRIFRS